MGFSQACGGDGQGRWAGLLALVPLLLPGGAFFQDGLYSGDRFDQGDKDFIYPG
ncbi:hypothetical protein I0Q91_04005 [Halanaerobiaceae bacterium Z-7014]|uniref:Uncharacterized protein n=1 Tax=Halonatronomonas betaini TaxID=2778430 RepID=A0A931ANV1_9FIRM|nr:hypothetical protein [Halonatronomonas betaini]MBF8436233.1 hypothetical protein [Halonatronomonas betaini]